MTPARAFTDDDHLAFAAVIGEAGFALQAAGHLLATVAAFYQRDLGGASLGASSGDVAEPSAQPAAPSGVTSEPWSPPEFTTLGTRRTERPEAPSSPTTPSA